MSHLLPLWHFVIFTLNKNNKISRMKHFKLNVETKFVPVADLCIAQVSKKDYNSIVEAFAFILVNKQITFDTIEKEGQMLVAKKEETSWSISE